MWRQLGRKLPLVLALGLSACTGNGLEEGQSGFVDGFFGGIMVDEPRAALIGRDVLSAGGNAADAAVAAYFTMAVTMPGGASLGGGGACLVHDRPNSRVEAIEFLAGAPANGGRNATVAIPANVRGMALLHARYGRLNWADLLVPAESFARDGHAISRAFARDLQAAAGTLRSDAEARRIFGLDGGEITEGRVVRQIELAAVLTLVRTRGAGEFYNGALGRQIAEAIQSSGAAMTADDLRDYRPSILKPLQFEIGNDLIYFLPSPVAGGAVAAKLWEAGDSNDLYSNGSAGERVKLLAETASSAYAKGEDAGNGPVIVDYSARGRHDGVSLVAVDQDGNAVACSFTLNRPFGADKMAPGTGILLAAPAGARANLPSAVIMANPVNDQVFFGAAMSGGSPAILAAVALETLRSGQDMSVAVAQARAYNTGRPDVMIAEPGVAKPVQDFLQKSGYTLQSQEALGRVNGFRCPEGLPRKPSCQFVAEPRAHGLAVSADER
jgi:gamma-glutamyltranspeptidase/glutathione hydrolase